MTQDNAPQEDKACCQKTGQPHHSFFGMSCCGGPEVMFAWIALKKKIQAAGGFKAYIRKWLLLE